MDKLVQGVLLGIMAAVIVFIGAVLSGTILYFIWPVAVPVVFPGLVASGVLAGKLSWFTSVCLTWIFGILIKSSTSQTVNK